jgi:hypothetical protein
MTNSGDVVEIKIAKKDLITDIETIFGSNSSIDECSCMWFILSVKYYHEGGRVQNRLKFRELIQTEKHPIGLLAYVDNIPVGWCAVGPRSRYVRAIRTPTYKGRKPSEDDHVWLIPCIFLQEIASGTQVTHALLERAVALAQAHGATAIEGFPHTGAKRRHSGDTQVGLESWFESCGFIVASRPSDNRIIMRRELGPSGLEQ